MIGSYGDTYLHFKWCPHTGQYERHSQRIPDTDRHMVDHRPCLFAVDPTKQHGKLVATDPCEQVTGPSDRTDPPAHSDQQTIAVLMTEATVDLAKAVDVDQHQRRGRPGHPTARR